MKISSQTGPLSHLGYHYPLPDLEVRSNQSVVILPARQFCLILISILSTLNNNFPWGIIKVSFFFFFFKLNF